MKRLFTLGLLLVLLAGALPGAVQAKSSTPDQQTGFPYFQNAGVLLRSHRVTVEIDNQVATTRIEQVFFNDSSVMAEGNYIFPLPVGAAVSDLVMWVNGQPVEAQILDADQARAIYDQIVRQMRDPALLEYVGAGAIQASVFPIQPNSEVKIEIEYGQLLTIENGLVKYEYPLRTDQFTRRPVENMSISVHVLSNDEIGAIYSPTHPVAISRTGLNEFRAGYEASYIHADTDFSLYYGIASEDISANLLTYRESANEDGFFTLMLTPPFEVSADRVIPKDVIIVLDQSGSMYGDKWTQAQAAVKFVLSSLYPEDRFNVIAFSTGLRIYANELAACVRGGWRGKLDRRVGSPGRHGYQRRADASDGYGRSRTLHRDPVPDRWAGDGRRSRDIRHFAECPGRGANRNARIFTFGVGDDVDTFLLDQLVQIFRGAGSYVRPTEQIDEEVTSLYNKISAPVLTNISVDFGDMVAEDMYPAAPLPDLFAGTQLIIVGRYRGDGTTTIRLTGELNGEPKEYRYEVSFPENAGGEVFIPRLWATRKIGALLNAIRLNGENPELVDSIVRLSIRYGIITPYTSFLIQEQDIFTQTGVEEAQHSFSTTTESDFAASSGQAAVNAAESSAGMAQAEAPIQPSVPPAAMDGAGGEGGYVVGAPQVGQGAASADDEYAPNTSAGRQPVQYAGDRAFVYRDGAWVDTAYNADEMTPTKVTFLSDEYFDLLALDPVVGEFLALGDHVLFVWDGQAYEVVPEE